VDKNNSVIIDPTINSRMELDDKMWLTCHPDDLWIYDKLVLSRKLNYICGPAGVPVPYPGEYIVRPITNIDGMGIGAKFVRLDQSTENVVEPGYFWCEVFKGTHLSVDYVNQRQKLCVEGIRPKHNPLYRWSQWKKSDDQVPFPKLLELLPYPKINCEFVGGRLIEVHLRGNPDWEHGSDTIFPVWEGQSTVPPRGMKFVEDDDYKRVGFFIPL